MEVGVKGKLGFGVAWARAGEGEGSTSASKQSAKLGAVNTRSKRDGGY